MIGTGLQSFDNNGVAVVDSRDVAKWVGKTHGHLCRDIVVYISAFSGQTTCGLVDETVNRNDYFIDSSYVDAKGESRRRYLLTHKGCEFVANKLTGKKGALFTAAYITRFHEYEEMLKSANNQKANLLLSIYNGGQGAIVASKELVELETAPLRAEAELLSARILEMGGS